METVTVVTYNVGTLNGEKPSLERVVSAIGKKGVPDLLLLQEVPDEAFALRIAGKLGLPYHAFGAYTANGSGYGLAVLSSRPLVNPAMHLLKPYVGNRGRCYIMKLQSEEGMGDAVTL